MFAAQGIDVTGYSDDQIRARVAEMEKRIREGAPTTAAEAATIILDGVKAEKWRILVGKDAEFLDDRVRAAPEDAYSPAVYEALSKITGGRPRRRPRHHLAAADVHGLRLDAGTQRQIEPRDHDHAGEVGQRNLAVVTRQ